MKRLMAVVCIAACTDNNGGGEPTPDPTSDCKLDVNAVSCTDAMRSGRQLQAFTPPKGKGAVNVTVATDAAGHNGYGSDLVVDGWAITFSSIIAVVDHVQMIDNPDHDISESDHVVAEARGPFAVDVLGDADPIPLASFVTENLTCGTPALQDKKYGFSYDVVAATYCAKNVNLAAGALTAYRDMADNGYSVMYTGHADFVGESCDETGLDHSMWPKQIAFRFGLKQALKLANCAGGITVRGTQGVKAEISLRTHLLFANALQDSGAEYFFDQVAARFADGQATGGLAHVEDFSAASFAPFQTLAGNPLPYRVCGSASVTAGDPMTFNAKAASASTYGEYLSQAILAQLRFGGTQTCERRSPTPDVNLADDDGTVGPK